MDGFAFSHSALSSKCLQVSGPADLSYMRFKYIVVRVRNGSSNLGTNKDYCRSNYYLNNAIFNRITQLSELDRLHHVVAEADFAELLK